MNGIWGAPFPGDEGLASYYNACDTSEKPIVQFKVKARTQPLGFAVSAMETFHFLLSNNEYHKNETENDTFLLHKGGR